MSATLNPDADLANDTHHTVAVTTGVTNDSYNPMTADFSSTFITETATPEPPPPSGFTLDASNYKVRGVQRVDLSWSGAPDIVDVYRDELPISTDFAGTSFTDNIGEKGGGTYSYQVCEAESSTCSNTVAVIF